MNFQKICIGIMMSAIFIAIPCKASAQETFTLAWSEYPSWSAFDAIPRSYLDGRSGQLGSIERKYNVDIELIEADYDTCMTLYASEQTDFVCITNMDALNPSLSVDSVAILPTSRSHGADALIVTNEITTLSDLRGKQVYGLSATVSDYAFYRFVQENDASNSHLYSFSNMDPAAASINMQQGEERFQAIVVWNPFVLNTLAARSDVRVLYDSSSIPNEIIDMVVANESSLNREGGHNAAKAIIESFYECNRLLNDPDTADDTLTAIGEKFSSLGLDSMRTVVEQTKFYSTPEQAIALYEGAELRATMDRVVGFCFEQGIVEEKPTVSYRSVLNDSDSNLTFNTAFLHEVSGQ